MILSRRAREFALSVLLFAAPVVLLYGGVDHPAALNPVDRAILRVNGNLQRAVHRGLGYAGSLWSQYVALWGLEARNEQLRRRYFLLRENNEILRYWAGKRRRLEAEIGFRLSPSLRTRPAEVVGWSISPYFQVARARLLRSGRTPRPWAPVAVPAGLLGSVRRSSGVWMDVLLLSDVQSRVKVAVARTASRGELRGTGTAGRMRGRIEYLSPRDAVRPGDLLRTSGMGGRFPRDLPVGRIVSVGRRIKSRYQEVEVELTAGGEVPQRVYLIEVRPPKLPAGMAGTRSGGATEGGGPGGGTQDGGPGGASRARGVAPRGKVR